MTSRWTFWRMQLPTCLPLKEKPGSEDSAAGTSVVSWQRHRWPKKSMCHPLETEPILGIVVPSQRARMPRLRVAIRSPIDEFELCVCRLEIRCRVQRDIGATVFKDTPDLELGIVNTVK